MLSLRPILGVLAVASLAVTNAHAQGTSGHPITIGVRGGGFSALSDLNDAGTLDTKTGYSVGTGIGYQISRHVVIRTDFTFARDELRTNGVDTGTHLNKFMYTAAIQLQQPFSNGVTPYIFAGGGGITVHEQGTTGINKTKAAGVGGLGIRYRLADSRWSVFTEGLGYLYKVRDFQGSLAGLDKTQFDVSWTGGLSISI
jgi:opacity protein-like surface antigen